MWLAPIRSGQGEQKLLDYENAMADWNNFIEDTNDFYGVDMSVLTQPYSGEQKKYYLQVSK
jgi:protein arginine N-methyltransferase 1